MKIMITGSKGMMGKAVLNAMKGRADIVTAPISRDECDLTNANDTAQIISAESPDLIIHLAAKVAGIGVNSRDPSASFKVNQAIDNAVIWGAFNHGAPKVILIGTSSMYPPSDKPIRETALLQGFPDLGNYGYALSKAFSTKLALMLNTLGKTQYRVLVAPNLYGPHDRTDANSAHLLGAIITKSLDAKTRNTPSIDMWGDGSARREFLFSEDLAAYLTDYAAPNFDRLPEIMNVGAGEDFSVLEWYQFVAEACGWSGDVVADPTKPSGAKRKILDSSVAAANHQWKPLTSPRDGVKALLNERKAQS